MAPTEPGSVAPNNKKGVKPVCFTPGFAFYLSATYPSRAEATGSNRPPIVMVVVTIVMVIVSTGMVRTVVQDMVCINSPVSILVQSVARPAAFVNQFRQFDQKDAHPTRPSQRASNSFTKSSASPGVRRSSLSMMNRKPRPPSSRIILNAPARST